MNEKCIAELPNFARQSVFSWLFERVKTDLTDAQLGCVGDELVGIAKDIARNAHSVAEGIGCLVQADQAAGSFRDQAPLSSLLFHLASSFDRIHDLLELAAGAEIEIELRRMRGSDRT